ncbi:MAG: tetratricopeptide repeat protein [Bryobacteraceae bacterium]
MRIPIALVIYVSLAAAAVFDCAAEVPQTGAPDWASTHTAGVAAFQRQSYEEAIECFQQSWSLSRGPAQRGISANDLGQAYRLLGRPNDAKEWLRQAYDVWRADPHAGHNTAVAASSLGSLFRDAGDYARAEIFLREALGVSNLDPDSAAMVRTVLADLLREQGRVAEARGLFLETVNHREGVLSKNLVNALIGLAEIDGKAGDREASAKEWNEVLAIARSEGDELSEAIASRGLGSMWLTAGDPARAEPLLRRSLSIMESNPGATPLDLANALCSMGLLYRAGNKLALAEAAWSRALELERKALGDIHPQVAWLREMLADVYAERGECDKARDYATQALEAMKRSLGEDALPTATAFANRAAVERRASDLDAAAKDYERAFGIAHAHPGNEPLEKVLIERYASLLKTMHRDRQAKELSALARSFHSN